MSDQKGFSPFKSICLVEYETQRPQVTLKGSGAIYSMHKTNDKRCLLFITSFQVLPITKKEEITGLKLVFDEKNIERPNPDWVNKLWISPNKVTVIELSTIAMTILSKANVFGLECVAPRAKEQVLLYQYQGDLVSGLINTIDETLLSCNFNNGSVSFGCPLLNFPSFTAVGIANDLQEPPTSPGEKKQSTYNNSQWAIRLDVIFEEYKAALIKEDFENTEIIDWLTKQKHIPNEALKLLGCGANSRVYTATQANGKEIGIKIIEKFGSFEAYKTEANTLENKIKLVKSLGIHSRIIEFFDS